MVRRRRAEANGIEWRKGNDFLRILLLRFTFIFSTVYGLPEVQVEGISEGHPPPKHWVIIVMAFRIKDYGMKNE